MMRLLIVILKWTLSVYHVVCVAALRPAATF